MNLAVPEDFLITPSGMKKSRSLTSVTSAVREQFRKRREKFRSRSSLILSLLIFPFLENQCAGIIAFLLLGTALNVFAYLASIWSAQLQQEVIKTAVENEHALKFKLKKSKGLVLL